jgi:hypothetical protein
MAAATQPAKKRKAKKNSGPTANKKGGCWPGFEPVPGKSRGTEGSCRRVPGPHSKATRQATQKAAAASKLEKQGKSKPNPKASR